MTWSPAGFDLAFGVRSSVIDHVIAEALTALTGSPTPPISVKFLTAGRESTGSGGQSFALTLRDGRSFARGQIKRSQEQGVLAFSVDHAFSTEQPLTPALMEQLEEVLKSMSIRLPSLHQISVSPPVLAAANKTLWIGQTLTSPLPPDPPLRAARSENLADIVLLASPRALRACLEASATAHPGMLLSSFSDLGLRTLGGHVLAQPRCAGGGDNQPGATHHELTEVMIPGCIACDVQQLQLDVWITDTHLDVGESGLLLKGQADVAVAEPQVGQQPPGSTDESAKEKCKINSILYAGAKAGDSVTFGIFTFNVYKQAGQGLITKLTETEIELEGSYDINVKVNGHPVAGQGSFKAQARQDTTGDWTVQLWLQGTWKTSIETRATCHCEGGAHKLTARFGVNNALHHLTANAWREGSDSSKTRYMKASATVTPSPGLLPTFYIKYAAP